jgi:hypothetical protein
MIYKESYIAQEIRKYLVRKQMKEAILNQEGF